MNILITVLVYSTILTIVAFYKDNSSYYTIGNIDVVIAGPMMWVALLFLYIFRKPISYLCKQYENRKYKPKSQKVVKRTVAKIMKNAKKRYLRNKTQYFDLTLYSGSAYRDWSGWSELTLHDAKWERLNIRFSAMMHHQKEETLTELKKYFIPVTKEIADADGYDCYFCRNIEQKNLMKINFNA